MVAAGKVKADQVKIVWTSDPLPNDALAVRKGLDAATRGTIAKTALSIDIASAATLLPPNYTGWIPAAPDTYAQIEAAGRALGKLA